MDGPGLRVGYAEQGRSPSDRRARIARVTGPGAEITKAGLEITDRMHQEVLDAPPPTQRDAFLAGRALITPMSGT